MATVDKNFKVKNGLIVGDSTNLVNYTSASPSDPFVGQLWISASSLYAWSSASTWVLIGDGNSGGGESLENLEGVLIQTASNNNILSYSSASSLWINKDLQSAIKEVDGTGSGIDSDLLDGQHGSYYQDAAGASATYLRQDTASAVYLPISASSNYLFVGTASATYLSQANASATYATQQDFDNLRIATIMGIY